MKKILYSIVLFCLLFGAAIPVKAAPLRSDPLLVCDAMEAGECLESTGNYIKASFESTGGDTFLIMDIHSTATIPDKKISVRWTVTGVENSSFAGNDAGLQYRITPQFGGNYNVSHFMGEGTSVATDETWTVIDHVFTSSNAQNFDVVVTQTRTFPTLLTSHIEGFIEVWVGAYPLECDEYDVVTPDEYVIDPTIELPLGPAGSPADDQIYPTVVASTYQIELLGAGWNDGTDPRDDAVISWDGETWVDLSTNCTGGAAGIYYITALTETFYIRANDEAEAFADNTQTDEEDPFSYAIGLALPPSSCESQFTFDPEDDLIGEVTVEGNDEDGIQATGTTGFSPIPEMVVTEWYAIVVTDGTWRDEGIAPDRTDMEFQVTFNTGFSTANYADLGGDGDGVWCQSTDETTWYIQARSTDLYLRVNNEASTFAANTGSLDVAIYHTAFERTLESCEINFDEYEAPSRLEVFGNAESGKAFAYVGGPDDPFAGLQGGAGAEDDPFYIESTSWSTRRLVPGAWYIIDTIEGPWIENNTSPNAYRYDMAVNDGESGWAPLEDWDVPACNVATDALGHRRIFFQVPEGVALEWFFRVNSSTFSNNGGYLAWNIYRAIEVDFVNPAFNPWAGCMDNTQNSYDVLAFASFIPVKFPLGTYVKGNINNGVGLDGVTTLSNDAAILETGGTYVIQLLGGPWDDDDSDEVLGDLYDAAVSKDNGVTWYPIDEDTPGAECISDDQQGRYFSYKFTVVEGEIWKIRVNDELTDFMNNGGSLSYHLYRIRNLYGAESGAGANPTTLCSGPFPRPAPPESLIDIPAWLDYVAGWVDYSAMTLRRFFSFCPRNINSIMVMLERMKTREPLASVVEAFQMIDDIQIEIASYDWGSNPQSTSIFDISNGGELEQIIDDHIFPTSSSARSPWEGGNIIDPNDFGGGYSPGSYYGTCLSAFDGYLPTAVAQGVCFVSAAFRDTGASFWIQLSFDVSCIFMLVAVTKRPLQEVIYMMTGVRPWTKSGAEAGIGKLVSYLERRDGKSDQDAQELSNRFGGTFTRGGDGSYRRRQ